MIHYLYIYVLQRATYKDNATYQDTHKGMYIRIHIALPAFLESQRPSTFHI